MAQQDPNGTGPAMPVAPQYVSQEPYGAEPVERPASITRAVQLMYVGAALSLVGLVVSWATKSQLHDKIAEANPKFSASEVDTVVNASLGGATVAAVIGVGLWLWMAAMNRAGKSWARIVATVLGALNVLITLAFLPRSAGISVVFQLISLLLAIAILVLLWRPTSSAYYRARSGARV